MALPILVIAGFYLVFTLVSRRLRSSVLTAPLVFTVFGLLMGNEALDLLGSSTAPSLVSHILEITLVLALFTDAAAIRLAELRGEARLALRLLAAGLPLTMIAGWGLAVPLFPSLGVCGALVVATILAPTDAALGQSVVANARTPALVRQGLAVESGLNEIPRRIHGDGGAALASDAG